MLAYSNSNGHALRLSPVANTSAKIVLATIALETVVLVEPVVSAEMPNAECRMPRWSK